MGSQDSRRQWADQSGEFSPEYYVYYGPNETSELIRDVLDEFVDTDGKILELGCSSGRHLSHLHEHGFTDLHGIDINDDAFDVMEDVYPELAADGTFHAAAIQDVVDSFDDGEFDAVFSVETLQHLHPDENVSEQLSRITDELFVTVENEGDDDQPTAEQTVTYVKDDIPLYYRNWNDIFTDLGFVEVHSQPTRRDTLRAFRSPE